MINYDSIYDSRLDTLKHREMVIDFTLLIVNEIIETVILHDESKLYEPELSIFNEYTPRLKGSTYGSEEYKSFLKEMKVALDHHYKNNNHHIEYFENGIQGMNLINLTEMFCDWMAATKRHNDGDIMKSIEINQERFGYSDDIKEILKNTALLLNEKS